MVLGKLPVPGRPTIWITVGQGPTALAVGAGGCGLDIFTLIYPFFPLSPSLWETARYRLKYCLKGPLNPKPTNQNMSQFRAEIRKLPDVVHDHMTHKINILTDREEIGNLQLILKIIFHYIFIEKPLHFLRTCTVNMKV